MAPTPPPPTPEEDPALSRTGRATTAPGGHHCRHQPSPGKRGGRREIPSRSLLPFAGTPISSPSLRERKENIPLLVSHFLHYYTSRTGKNVSAISANVMSKLVDYNWPGNVRELQHLVERSILLASDGTINEIELPDSSISPDTIPNGSAQSSTVPHYPPKTLEEMERAHILEVLRQCNFGITGKGGAAEILKLSPGTLYSKIKKLGITKFYKVP